MNRVTSSDTPARSGRPGSGWPLVLAAIVIQVSLASAAERRPLTGKFWIDMDYGQFMSLALEVEKGNIAHKGIAIRLDGSEGGVTWGSEFVVFDTDTLRYAAGWTGPRFINWTSIVYDGSHQTHASIVGSPVFRNPPGPGWARPGTETFADARVEGRDGVHYGPLPRHWAHWKGLYRHGKDVILSYTVGETMVLETPSSASAGEIPAVVRTLNVGPRTEDLCLQVAREEGFSLALRSGENARSPLDVLAVLAPRAAAEAEAEARPASRGLLRFDGATSLEVDGSGAFDLSGDDFTIRARLRTRGNGTILAKAPREGDWAPDGKTFFVRGGRLGYDIGWVGVVTSRRRVNDGEWHDVAATYASESGVVRLWIDGELDAERELRPGDRAGAQVVRIGYTSPDFPQPSGFEGEISELSFFQRRLEPEELRGSAGARDRLVAHWKLEVPEDAVITDLSGNGHGARIVDSGSIGAAGGVVVAAVIGGPQGLRWLEGSEGRLRLSIPAGEHAVRLAVVLARAPSEDEIPEVAALVRGLPAPRNLAPLTRGGPSRWNEEVVTEMRTLGRTDGPFVIETITTPMDNPYRSWIRPGGFDFFSGGQRAAVGTWQGDVWIVDGLGGELGEFVWRRFAAGLYQPLGLKIVDDVIYALGRDQITRLHDLDGDGEADFYESFNNDAIATEHFHEFAMDLQTDDRGNFYYTKGGRHALDAVVPQHGTLLKVTPDGARTEIIAHGFRAPNGLCVNPDGTFIVSDQEGHWTPENRINWVKPGGFYGYMWAYDHPPEPTGYDGPLCWVDHDLDISPAEQLWVESDRWGPLPGQLLSLSYGNGHITLVLHEQVNGVRQGGVTRLPIDLFPTGIMRGRFHPGDGQLYVAGLFGWSSQRTFPGGFYRVRYTGKPIHTPVALHATTKGVFLRFSDPLDRRRAERAGSYRVTRWNYRWLPRYGTDDFRVSDGEPGRERVEIQAVHVSEDGRSVFLDMEDIRPCMQQKIEYRLQAADRTRMSQEILHTIHVLGEADAYVKECGG